MKTKEWTRKDWDDYYTNRAFTYDMVIYCEHGKTVWTYHDEQSKKLRKALKDKLISEGKYTECL